VLNLASVASVLQVVTAAPVTAIECHASWVDVALIGTTIGPGSQDTPPITTAGTTVVVPAPALAVVRNVKFLSVVNTDPLLSCAIVIQHFDGAVTELFPVTLPAGWMVHYNTDGPGFQLYDQTGALQ
jgi:hypothetical protein